MEAKVSSYSYVGRDLLAEPEYYFYSTYEGTPFLQSFSEFRDGCAEQVLGSYQDLTGSENPIITLLDAPLEEFSGCLETVVRKELDCDTAGELPPYSKSQDRIETDLILRALLVSLLCRDIGAGNGRAYQWLSHFIRRFEVKKRIFDRYSQGIHPEEDAKYRTLSHYALLSLSAGVFYERAGNFKALSAVLKLNDVLCAMRDTLSGSEELLLSFLALRCEAKVIRDLALAQGVEF